jgi:hypothetical protein
MTGRGLSSFELLSMEENEVEGRVARRKRAGLLGTAQDVAPVFEIGSLVSSQTPEQCTRVM